MLSIYVVIFVILVIFSAFFSSAETSLLSLNKIKLAHRVKKNNKKAILLTKILKAPDEFFSTILIGNNLVNIAAASISTILFSKLLRANENVVLLVSTISATIIILFFAEVIPKTYAFQYSEKLSYFYAYPIKFFKVLFYPLVVVVSLFSNFFFKKKMLQREKKEFSPEEIKHFLESEVQLFKYHPETLKIMHEIIDIAQKDIKSVMTPRPNIIALDEKSDLKKLKNIILEKKISKIPLFKDSLSNITGIIHTDHILFKLLTNEFKNLNLQDISVKPVFVSEYSSLNYVIKELKKKSTNIAVILDEYGATLGIVTLNDIFREIFEEIEIKKSPVKKVAENVFLISGNLPVEELNNQLNISLPERKDYTTLSGLFIYHFGKFPRLNNKISVENHTLVVKRMGKRKIEEIELTRK